MTVGPFRPSKLRRGSYLPGPQLVSTVLTVATSTPRASAIGWRFGDRETIRPTLRSRLGQPSRRLPTPGANELSTFEWHSAQVNPTRVTVSLPFTFSTVPFTPITALSLTRATVVAGSVRLIVPFVTPSTTAGGSASESTFRPTVSAVVGSTALTTCSMCRVSVHLVSSPNVSKRNVCLPCATSAALSSEPDCELPPQPAASAAATPRAPSTTARRARRIVSLFLMSTPGWALRRFRALSWKPRRGPARKMQTPRTGLQRREEKPPRTKWFRDSSGLLFEFLLPICAHWMELASPAFPPNDPAVVRENSSRTT